MKVNILLSTYNGQDFLAEQIQSIQQQTFQDWRLLIRDDGSSDATMELIQQFVTSDPRISWLNPEDQTNYGVIASFYTLVKAEEADYYFFSDQDDVWLPEKLEKTLAQAQHYPKDKPLLVYTDLTVVDQNLQTIYPSMIATQSHHANTELVQELTENTVTGGTMMINRALADLWQTTDNLLMHDWYLALLASAFGHLAYLDEPTQLYRQHDNNVLGARTWTKRMANWLKPNQLVSKYWWLITSSQKQASHLLALPLSQEKRELVEAFVGLLNQPLLGRLKTLKTYGFRKNRAFHSLVFWTLIGTKLGYRNYLKTKRKNNEHF